MCGEVAEGVRRRPENSRSGGLDEIADVMVEVPEPALP